MNSLKKILKQFAYPYKKEFLLGVFFNILYSLFSIVSVLAIMPVLEMLLGGKSNEEAIIEKAKKEVETSNGFSAELKYEMYQFFHKHMEGIDPKVALAYLCGSVIVLFLLRNVFRYLAQYFIVLLRSGVSKDLRLAMFDKIISLPVSYFTERKKGDIMIRLSGDVGEVEGNILNALLEIWRTPFSLLFTLITLIVISPQLTLIALVVLPFMAWIISAIGKSLKKDARRGLTESGNVLSIIDETLNGAKVIKIFNAEESMKNRFMNSVLYLRKLSINMMKKYELASPSSEFLGSVAMIFITWYGGVLILEGRGGLSLPSFLVYVALFFQLLEPAKTLSTSLTNLHKGSASTDRLVEVLETSVQIYEPANPVILTELKEGIRFDNIDFQYQEGHPILQDVTIDIPKGKTVAIVGQSGGGKTTLANLLARFYDVSKGKILIDGHDLRDLSLKNYRKLLGMVTQESILFHDTIANNIKLSNPNATMDEVINAAKVANALEFIELLPEGFNTSIGESGAKLSGGQKQRIAIARAILKNPPVMILDEATSALDTQSERLVQEALENLMSNRTSLVIAHRLSTIVNSDLIVVMERGKVIEQGTHVELIEKDGAYKRLIDMQKFS